MKRFRHITIVTAIVLLLCSSFAFAGAAAIVSPAANTIVYSDSLLVSVKVTEPKTVRVTVYEEKETSGETLVSANVTAFTEADLALVAAKRLRARQHPPSATAAPRRTTPAQPWGMRSVIPATVPWDFTPSRSATSNPVCIGSRSRRSTGTRPSARRSTAWWRSKSSPWR